MATKKKTEITTTELVRIEKESVNEVRKAIIGLDPKESIGGFYAKAAATRISKSKKS